MKKIEKNIFQVELIPSWNTKPCDYFGRDKNTKQPFEINILFGENIFI